MTKLLRLVAGFLGCLLLANAGILWSMSNINLGLIMTTVIGFILLFYALFSRLLMRMLDNRFGLYMKLFSLILTIYFIFTTTLITVSGRTNSVTYKEDAIIVLGAAVHGEEVSRILASRLDTALQYHAYNPKAYIVVSGGQGQGETISEAAAMAKYLENRGVDPSKILLEPRATSTYENFMFSKQILDKQLGNEYQTAYITNHFHVYRAGRIAKNAGVRAAHLSAENTLITLIPDYLREGMAIGFYWLKNIF